MTGYDISTTPSRRGAAVPPADLGRIRRDGLLCVAGGAIAVAGAAWLATQPVPEPGSLFSAPQSPGTWQALELVWTLTHVLTLFGALGLARSGVASGTRLGRAGVRTAVLGMALLVPAELAFIPFARSLATDPGPTAVSTAIGVASILAGAGFVLAGVAVLRARAWSGAARWIPLAVGLWVFVGLLPMVFAGGRVFYLGIGGWNLLLALLGAALLRAAAGDGTAPRS